MHTYNLSSVQNLPRSAQCTTGSIIAGVALICVEGAWLHGFPAQCSVRAMFSGLCSSMAALALMTVIYLCTVQYVLSGKDLQNVYRAAKESESVCLRMLRWRVPWRQL